MRRHSTTPPKINETELVSLIKQWAYTLSSEADLQPLFDRIGDSRIVMLGEASHGTHEYYTWRVTPNTKLTEIRFPAFYHFDTMHLFTRMKPGHCIHFRLMLQQPKYRKLIHLGSSR